MSSPEEYIPATRVVPDPEHGWSGKDLSENELVDDEFVASAAARTYPPLQPEDEKLFPVEES